MKQTYFVLLLMLIWSCQDKAKLKTSDSFEYDREISLLKSLRKDSINNKLIYNFKFGMTEDEVNSLKDSLKKVGLFDSFDELKIFYDKSYQLENSIKTKKFVKGDIRFIFENEKLSKLFIEMREPDLRKIIKIYTNLYSIPDVHYQSDNDYNKYNWIIGNQEIEILDFGSFMHIYHFDYTSVSLEELEKRKEELDRRVYVGNDDYDGSVKQVEAYLKGNLKDPRSYESISWSKVMHKDSYYLVRHEYRAKNTYGGYVIENKLFYIDLYGEIYKIEELNN